jgi:hypothetical protein
MWKDNNLMTTEYSLVVAQLNPLMSTCKLCETPRIAVLVRDVRPPATPWGQDENPAHWPQAAGNE